MRLRTYLAPGIPLAFYETIATYLADALAAHVTLDMDPRFSGPARNEPNPLATGEVDIAFMCGPSYLRLRDEVQLIPAAPVFDDPRSTGRPVYFAEVAVRRDSPVMPIGDLASARLAYNDEASLSGRLGLLAHLGSLAPPQIVDELDAGSAEAALGAVVAGSADVCSVDSVVWNRLCRDDPDLVASARVIATLGPYPIQPVVAGRHLDPATVACVADALLAVPHELVRNFAALGFATIAERAYDELADLLSVLESAPVP